jgi:hypothetical protein
VDGVTYYPQPAAPSPSTGPVLTFQRPALTSPCANPEACQRPAPVTARPAAPAYQQGASSTPYAPAVPAPKQGASANPYATAGAYQQAAWSNSQPLPAPYSQGPGMNPFPTAAAYRQAAWSNPYAVHTSATSVPTVPDAPQTTRPAATEMPLPGSFDSPPYPPAVEPSVYTGPNPYAVPGAPTSQDAAAVPLPPENPMPTAGAQLLPVQPDSEPHP